jgi:hypothetical protein
MACWLLIAFEVNAKFEMNQEHRKMQICLCVTQKAAQPVALLEALIRDAVPAGCLHSYREIGEFAKRLKDPRITTDIAVLIPADESELRRFAQLRKLSDLMRIILVLPLDSPELIVKGHALRPRFITFADAEPVTVLRVLEKMMGMEKERKVRGAVMEAVSCRS